MSKIVYENGCWFEVGAEEPKPTPTPDTVEAVARAICLDDGDNPDAPGYKGQLIWQTYIGNAIAAIAAYEARRK